MPLQSTSGAASYDAFGGGVAAVPKYIEEYFSTFLYTDNGSTQTINNGIDLAGKGGFVWAKCRSAVDDHIVWDSARGTSNYLIPNKTNAQATYAATFNSNGVSIPSLSTGQTYTSWSWAKAPKFFDVVTYTGNGVAGRQIAHSLGSAPGCIIVKSTSNAIAWQVYHRSTGATDFLVLNTTAATQPSISPWNNTAPTSSVFTVGDGGGVNLDGATYVAYLFAHDAGGFGLTGTDNVISCGSFTTSSGVATVNLGYEPQWILYRLSSQQDNWWISDNMRGMSMTQNNGLFADISDAESNQYPYGVTPTSTGFTYNIGSGTRTGIYIAIRRGPMKVPTSGTSVFSPVAYTGNGSTRTFSVGFPTDLSINMNRSSAGNAPTWNDRLRGSGLDLYSNDTGSEQNNGVDGVQFNNQTNIVVPSYRITNGTTYIDWCMRRAPSFFDEVCYTGTGSANTAFTHNLTVTPELMIVKPRSAATAPNWRVWSPINSTDFNLLQLSTNGAASSSLYSSSNVFPAIPTATTFTVGGSGSIQLNESGQTFVAYLFATCAGVSKCFNYTGNGSSQTINCGFTGGARWILIKRTDSTGDWYVWDSARGIVSGNDPHLSLNSTAAEVTTDDTIDTDSTGFVVNQVSATNVNVSSATYIGIAIA